MLVIFLMKKIKFIKIVLPILYYLSFTALMALEENATSNILCQDTKDLFVVAEYIHTLGIPKTGGNDNHDLQKNKEKLIKYFKSAIDENSPCNKKQADLTQAIYLLYDDLYQINHNVFDGLQAFKYIKITVDLAPNRLVPLLNLLEALIEAEESFGGSVGLRYAKVDSNKAFYFLVKNLTILGKHTDPKINKDLRILAYHLDIDTEDYKLPDLP